MKRAVPDGNLRIRKRIKINWLWLTMAAARGPKNYYARCGSRVSLRQLAGGNQEKKETLDARLKTSGMTYFIDRLI